MTARGLVARPIGRLTRLPILAPLAIRDFRLVWFGEAVSLLGDQFQTVAIAFLVLDMTGSGLALGSILIAAAIPRGIFLLLGGVLADRVSPRNLALGSNLMRAVLTAIVAGLVLGAQVQLWHLALVGILFGTVDAVFWPAINTLVPRLVPIERLAASNAIMQGTGQLVGTVGPAMAGFGVALIGVGVAYVIDAVSFAVAALALWFVRSGATAVRPGEPTQAAPTAPTKADAIATTDLIAVVAGAADPTATEEPGPPSIVASLIDGARSVLGDPVMRSIVILSTGVNLAFNGPVVVGLPWLVFVRFGGDAAALGLLFAAFGGGSVVGVLLAGSLGRPRWFGWLVLVLVIAMGIGLAAIGLAQSVPDAALILLVIGLMNGYVNVVMIAWVQEKTEPAMLGRTMSFLMLGSVVAAPLSIAVAAVLVDTAASAMFLAAGALVTFCGLIAIVSGLPRRMSAAGDTIRP